MNSDERFDLIYNYLTQDNEDWKEFLDRDDVVLLACSDKIVIEDKCISGGVSWGYQDVEVIIVEGKETVTNKLRKDIEKIDDDSNWKCLIEGRSYVLTPMRAKSRPSLYQWLK